MRCGNCGSRAKRLARYKRYRENNKARRAAYMKLWRIKNATHRAEYHRRWKAKQPKQYWKRWDSWKRQRKNGRWPNGSRTPAETLKANRDLRRKQRQQISDSYLRGWMSRTTGYTIKPSEWPSDLVEAKRAQLKLTRLCRASRTTLN